MPPPGDYTLTPVEHDPWAEAQTHQAERPNPAAPIVNFGKLFAKTMAGRAVSAVTSAVTAPRDALFGNMQVTDPETGMPSGEAMKRGQDVANLAMTGGIPFARAGAAGMAGGKLTQPALVGPPKTFYEISRQYPSRSNDAFHRGASAYERGETFPVPPSSLTKEELKAWDDGVEARMHYEAQPQPKDLKLTPVDHDPFGQ